MRTDIVHIGAGELIYKIYQNLIFNGRTTKPLAAAGICVVPLTSFSTDLQGFRFTLLEQDEDAFRQMIEKLAMSITNYLES